MAKNKNNAPAKPALAPADALYQKEIANVRGWYQKIRKMVEG